MTSESGSSRSVAKICFTDAVCSQREEVVQALDATLHTLYLLWQKQIMSSPKIKGVLQSWLNHRSRNGHCDGIGWHDNLL